MVLMAWYYNSDSGSINESPESIAWLQLHMGLGWHGPFKSKQDTINYYNTYKSKNPGWKAPTGIGGTIVNTIVEPVTGPISDTIGSFNLGAWFVRIGEVLLGLILIGVGVAKLTGTSNAISSIVKAKL
jgi:hypothetical protein